MNYKSIMQEEEMKEKRMRITMRMRRMIMF